MNRSSIGAINFTGSAIDCPVSRASTSGEKVAMNGRWQLNIELHRLVVDKRPELELCYRAASCW